MRMLKYSDTTRNNSEDQRAISSILKTVASNADIESAEQRLLALASFQEFVAALEPGEMRGFQCHLRRYLQAHLPECPFVISRTNRYSPANYEATVVAQSQILRGQEIKFLRGITVPLRDQQEDDLQCRGLDFSIIWSS